MTALAKAKAAGIDVDKAIAVSGVGYLNPVGGLGVLLLLPASVAKSSEAQA